MKNQVATILQNGIKEAIEAASSHLSEETRPNILGDLAQYAKSGTGKTLFSLACYSDGLRTIVFALCADGEISVEEKILAGDFLRSAAGFFAKFRPEYRSFADLQSSQIEGFIKHYLQDSGSFGFKNESTRWAGIYICQRIAEFRGDRIPIDAMRSALISAAEEVITADGVTADEEEFLALLKEKLGMNNATSGERESGNKVLVKYSFYTRSHDDVEGLFVTTEEKLAVVQGQKFCYWIDEDEIELEFDDILSVQSRDRAFIDQVEKVLGRVICGSDIVEEYIEENQERLDKMREQFGAVADLPENYVERPGTITNSNGMKLVRIPAGTFMMGSPEDEVERSDSETLHQVTLSQDYYMGVFPVTQAEYFRVMGVNPSQFQGDAVDDENSASHPVEQVTWDEAVEFCRRLSERPEEKAAGRVYRLPTEAEWEYACRAGSQTAWCFGSIDDWELLKDYAWYCENSEDSTHPVGLKKPNAWGLYDMYGNVWEWCSDWYSDLPTNSATDPMGPEEGWRSDSGFGPWRVSRGGSWGHEAADCRSANRVQSDPSDRSYSDGFRVALSPSGIPK